MRWQKKAAIGTRDVRRHDLYVVSEERAKGKDRVNPIIKLFK